jgi:PAS domain S-box-containing protein
MDNGQQHTILVVDDESFVRRLLKKRLETWDFRVNTAKNGREAIDHIQSNPPDVVITDLFMPVEDGFELLCHMRDKVPETPVVVMSGQGELGDVIRALRLGAWDYLYMPLENMEFLRLTVERVLEKADLIRENRNYRDHLEKLVAEKEVALLASEKRYRTVADFTYDWEYWIDPDGYIVYMSPSCERITGYSSREFVDNPSLIQEIIHPGDRDVFEFHLNDNRMSTQVCHIDFRVTGRGGEECWIGHCCQPVADTDGGYLGRRCSNRDITLQKKMEIDLVNQKQALVEKTISQEKTNEALKALLDQREFEKQSIEQSMVTNLKRFVFPYLDELERTKKNNDFKTYVKIIRTNIEQLISPASKSLSGAFLNLTPTEVKVADFIRHGQSTKSIAAILNISPSTVEKHRNKIRKKLNLLEKKINLHTYLNSLS